MTPGYYIVEWFYRVLLLSAEQDTNTSELCNILLTISITLHSYTESSIWLSSPGLLKRGWKEERVVYLYQGWRRCYEARTKGRSHPCRLPCSCGG